MTIRRKGDLCYLGFAADSPVAKACRKGAKDYDCTPEEYFAAAIRHELAEDRSGNPIVLEFTKAERAAYRKIRGHLERFQKFVDAEKAKRPPVKIARAAQPPLALSTKHSRTMRMFARMLDMEPDRWLGWIIQAYINDLSAPNFGLLEAWSRDLIDFPDEATAAKVRARVDAWQAKRSDNKAKGKGAAV